ncbi:MAG TPA: hypothetical protein PLA74_03645 [Syntrophales bacterium]|nr:hypothetical protein [Syntrophales bacterium]HPQ44213.1 hypothetical protein [Syntrophales bacterium]
MPDKPYISGTFCRKINCAHHTVLDDLEGNEYIEKKTIYCKDCYAWQFYNWLKDNNWRVIKTFPEMPARELAAHIKGIDPSQVEDFTMDEILCL